MRVARAGSVLRDRSLTTSRQIHLVAAPVRVRFRIRPQKHACRAGSTPHARDEPPVPPARVGLRCQ